MAQQLSNASHNTTRGIVERSIVTRPTRQKLHVYACYVRYELVHVESVTALLLQQHGREVLEIKGVFRPPDLRHVHRHGVAAPVPRKCPVANITRAGDSCHEAPLTAGSALVAFYFPPPDNELGRCRSVVDTVCRNEPLPAHRAAGLCPVGKVSHSWLHRLNWKTCLNLHVVVHSMA